MPTPGRVLIWKLPKEKWDVQRGFSERFPVRCKGCGRYAKIVHVYDTDLPHPFWKFQNVCEYEVYCKRDGLFEGVPVDGYVWS